MDTLADVLSRAREHDGAVLDAPDRRTPHSYSEFATGAWKAGNLLRHYGVRPGSRVAVVVGPKSPGREDEPGWLGDAADPLLALFGAAAVGATVDVTLDPPVDARALVLPDAWLGRYDASPGCSRIAYGGPPDLPGVAHFGRERWSENPTEPPGSVAPGDAALQTDGHEFTHADLVDASAGVVRDHGLETGDTVAVDASLTSAGTVVAGVVAPLVAGATVQPVGGASADGNGIAYTVRAGGGENGEGDGDVIDPSAVIC
jgi:acyl-CoA synthetase (AMP-forming)/AMP-acid ligase II